MSGTSALGALVGPLNLEQQAQLLDLIGNPFRLQILFMLVEQESMSVSDMEEVLPVSASRHLQLLAARGLIDYKPKGSHHLYFLTEEGRKLLEECLSKLLDKFRCPADTPVAV